MNHANKKVALKFECIKCNYTTSKKSSWNKHVQTKKHLGQLFDKKCYTKVASDKTNLNVCDNCGKVYKHYTSLFRHKKNCMKTKETKPLKKEPIKKPKSELEKQYYETLKISEEIKGMKTFMENLIQQQQETKDQLHKLNETSTGNTTNNMTINLFLNHYCKDAMNMTDFLSKLQLSMEDLFYTKENGYVKGISNIIVKNLQDLKPTERPIHCSDKKRLHFYVKDENKWEKDETNQINKSISAIRNKQIKQIKEWEKEHPNWNTNDEETELYAKMVQEVMGYGSGNKNKEDIKKEISEKVDVQEIKEFEI